MRAILVGVRFSMRRQARALLAIALLVGVAGGTVIAAVSGARRTESAYPRFLAATDAPDVAMPIFPWLPIARYNIGQVASLPQVERVDLVTNFFTKDGPTFGAAADTATIDHLKILKGRRPDPSSLEEFVIGFTAAERLHVDVGSRLNVTFEQPEGSRSPPLVHRFKIVGVSAAAGDFPPVEESVPTWAAGFATPAFYSAFSEKTNNFKMLAVHLRRGNADLGAFENELERSIGQRGYLVFRERDHTYNVQRSIHLQGLAMWLLAGLVAFAAILILSQALARQMFLASTEHPVLSALGMTRRQLWLIGVARAAGVAIVGAGIAMIVAVLLSPLTPIGIARVAEPSGGFAIDGPVFVLAAASMLVLVVAFSAVPAWWAARSRVQSEVDPSARRGRPSIAARFARSTSPSAGAGIRMALEAGRGSTAVPVRTTIAAVTIGVAALGTALGFAGSLTHLSRTPRLYGANWDATFFVESGVSSLSKTLTSDRRIAAYSASSGGLPLSVGPVPIQAVVMEGSIMPPLLDGRSPEGAGADREIVLGAKTLKGTGAHLGDVIAVHVQGQSKISLDMRIVGVAVFPPTGADAGLGKGALVNPGAATTLVGGALTEGLRFDNELLVRFAPGIDKRAAFADFQRQLDPEARLAHPIPADIVNFGRVGNLPILMAGGLALLATATIAHALTTSVRRRRRDLAVLKTLGFIRSQVRWSIAWQATTIVVVSLAIGVPLGLAASRWAWIIFARQIGVIPEPRASYLAVFLIVPGAILVANLLAALPARTATRMAPAVVLHAE
jgi:ABC-type lipoprotein release transport system permease subunit